MRKNQRQAGKDTSLISPSAQFGLGSLGRFRLSNGTVLDEQTLGDGCRAGVEIESAGNARLRRRGYPKAIVNLLAMRIDIIDPACSCQLKAESRRA
jgi:hypothetical protein